MENIGKIEMSKMKEARGESKRAPTEWPGIMERSTRVSKAVCYKEGKAGMKRSVSRFGGGAQEREVLERGRGVAGSLPT